MNAYHLTPIERAAARMFRIVHGKGDGGSVHAFLSLNPEILKGWIRLARAQERELALINKFYCTCRRK